MSQTGYVNVELNSLQLNFAEDPSPDSDLVLQAVVTIVDSSNVFKWASSGETTVSSAELTAFRKPVDEEVEVVPADPVAEGGEASEPVAVVKPETVYTLGFEKFASQMTQYIDLEETVLAALAATVVKVSISQVAKEGEEVTTPLVELCLPLSTLMQRKGCTMSSGNSSLDSDTITCATGVSRTVSTMNFTVYADNNLAEACMGCKVLQWKSANLLNPPASWGLEYTEPVDPKAKVQPTAAELRAKYLAAIPGLIDNQASHAVYSLTIGVQPVAPVEGEGEAATTSIIPVTVIKGKLAWNAELASAIGEDDDIKAQGQLWSLSFGDSTSEGGASVFLSRSRVRSFIEACNNGSVSAIPISLSKTPLDASGVATGEALTASGSIDLSSIGAVGALSTSCSCVLTGEGFDVVAPVAADSEVAVEGEVEAKETERQETSPVEAKAPVHSFSIDMAISSALIERVPEPMASSASVNSTHSATKYVKQSSNRDAISELKQQITSCVRTIATEYLAIYPASENSNINKDNKSYEDKKIEFLHYLSTSGTYHSLKEELKPKIQRAVRAHFGSRGQAMQASTSVSVSELNVTDGLLSELYVFLVKQCNHVLNGIFHATVIDRDTADLTQQATIIDDEDESPHQKLSKLLQQALDAEADGRVVDAEQRHLERLQLITNISSLNNESTTKHDVYCSLGLFYLKQSSKALQSSCASSSWGDTIGASSHKAFAEYNASRAREALSAASNVTNINDMTTKNAALSIWSTQQLLACLFHENGQTEESRSLLQAAIEAQLTQNNGQGSGMASFEEFPGYDSDKLCGDGDGRSGGNGNVVDSNTYSVLAVHFSCCNDQLKARKALRLAVRSFSNSEEGRSSSTGGTVRPVRRTYVLVLAKAILYCTQNGFMKLAVEARKMMISCDKDVDTVARSRNAATTTDPSLRCLMKRADVETSLIVGLTNAEIPTKVAANDTVLCSESNEDTIYGWLCVAIASFCEGDSVLTCEALCSAVGIADTCGLHSVIPLERYLQCSKLLLSAGRVDAALNIAMTGQRVHISASLALVAGICYLRLDLPEQSEIALREANILDNRNAEIWAYHGLMCLAIGYSRLNEAEAALAQSLRLGLAAAPVLREMGTAFIAVDKLQVAEDLIRRALAAEGGKGSPYTRKLLGDVLAGQQQAVQAINEYQTLIDDGMNGTDVEPVLQLQAAEQCLTLLKTLGRTEEAVTLQQIINKLKE